MTTDQAQGAAENESVHIDRINTLKARIEQDLAELETEFRAEENKASGFATTELQFAKVKLQEGLHWLETHLKKLV